MYIYKYSHLSLSPWLHDTASQPGVVVFLTMNVFTVREDAGFANITIQATKANFEAYIVVVTVTEGSATGMHN